MTDIFLSYSAHNRDFVLKLRQDLENAGYSSWIDNQKIKGGDQWVSEIENNLRVSTCFLVCVSEHSNVSPWVRREAILAEKLSKKRIPILLDQSDLPLHLLDLQYIDFRSPEDGGSLSYSESMKELLAILQSSLIKNKRITFTTTQSSDPTRRSPEDENDSEDEGARKPASEPIHSNRGDGKNGVERRELLARQDSQSSVASPRSFTGTLGDLLSSVWGKFATFIQLPNPQQQEDKNKEKDTTKSGKEEETEGAAIILPPQERLTKQPPARSSSSSFAISRKRPAAITKPLAPQRKKKKVEEDPRHLVCKRCGRLQPRANFSEKQLQHRRSTHSSPSSKHCNPAKSKPHNRSASGTLTCRHCEGEQFVQHELSSELQKYCTRLYISCDGGTVQKFLCAIVPTEPHRRLPAEITLDGYTRASWSLASEREGWETHTLKVFCSSDGISGFLRFMKQHQKSAYGTFLLTNPHDGRNTDGFFCIPFDQPTNTTSTGGVVLCKFVLELGLNNDDSGAEAPAEEVDKDSCRSPDRIPEDYVSKRTLSALLLAHRKTDGILRTAPRSKASRGAFRSFQSP